LAQAGKLALNLLIMVLEAARVSQGVNGLLHCHVSCQPFYGDILMQWTTPAFTDLRFGFEITMYIANR
jgi:coenzyme PQQ precursor peptide PqqA